MKKNYIQQLFVLNLCIFGVLLRADEDIMPHKIERQPENALRVITYNIRRDGKESAPERKWAERKPKVAAIINELPDIIGMQEAKQNQIDDLVSAGGFLKVNPPRPIYAAFGEGRGTSWWGLGENEICPLMYRATALELLEKGTFQLNPTNSMMWLLDVKGLGLLPRVCTYGKFKDKQTGAVFFMYNTHLDHKFKEAQLNGLRTIKEHIDTHACNLPVIITGDFNTELTDEVKQVLPGFTAARSMAQTTFGPDKTRTGWNDEELKHIDHILISDSANAQVSQYGVIESPKPYPSDHRPVMADIIFDAKE